MGFDGFDPTALALLDELPGWTADTFAAHRDQLTAGLVAPARALIAELAERLEPALTADPRRSVSPLHRDLRFAPAGAARYKDHLLLTAWEGSDKSSAATLWVRVDAHRAGFASGIAFGPAVRDRWRDAVAGPAGAQLADLLDALVRDRAADIAGDEVKRVPRPHPPDHPRADLLRRTGFQVRFIEDLPAEVGHPGFADWCLERLTALVPIHRWVVAHLTT